MCLNSIYSYYWAGNWAPNTTTKWTIKGGKLDGTFEQYLQTKGYAIDKMNDCIEIINPGNVVALSDMKVQWTNRHPVKDEYQAPSLTLYINNAGNLGGCGPQSHTKGINVVTYSSNPPPSISNINGPTSFNCHGDNLTYSFTGNYQGSVSWQVPAGWTITSGQGTRQINVNTNGKAGGTIKVFVYSLADCFSTTKSLNVSTSTSTVFRPVFDWLPVAGTCANSWVTYSVETSAWKNGLISSNPTADSKVPLNFEWEVVNINTNTNPAPTQLPSINSGGSPLNSTAYITFNEHSPVRVRVRAVFDCGKSDWVTQDYTPRTKTTFAAPGVPTISDNGGQVACASASNVFALDPAQVALIQTDAQYQTNGFKWELLNDDNTPATLARFSNNSNVLSNNGTAVTVNYNGQTAVKLKVTADYTYYSCYDIESITGVINPKTTLPAPVSVSLGAGSFCPNYTVVLNVTPPAGAVSGVTEYQYKSIGTSPLATINGVTSLTSTSTSVNAYIAGSHLKVEVKTKNECGLSTNSTELDQFVPFTPPVISADPNFDNDHRRWIKTYYVKIDNFDPGVNYFMNNNPVPSNTQINFPVGSDRMYYTFDDGFNPTFTVRAEYYACGTLWQSNTLTLSAPPYNDDPCYRGDFRKGKGLTDAGTAELSMYPNPAGNAVSLMLYSEEAVNWTYKIYDLMGREVTGGTSSIAEKVIDLSAIANGLYTVKVVTDTGKEFTERLQVIK